MNKTTSIFFVPVGGLGNRMRAIESAHRLARHLHANLNIGWFQDWGMKCGFNQILKPIPNIPVIEDSILNKLLFDRPRKKNLFIPTIYQHLHFDKCFYETECGYRDINFETIDKNDCWIASCKAFYPGEEDYSIFQPIDTLQEKIDHITRTFPHKIEGLQIRRTDHVEAIQSSKRQYFEQIINHADLDTFFYLSTDSLEEKQYFINKYRDRIFTIDATLSRGSAQGIQDAIVDMFALSYTKIIHGSKNSSFGQIAAKIGKIHFNEVTEIC